MKQFISVICGLATGFGMLVLANSAIKGITSGMENHDLQVIIRILLWILGAGLIIGVTVITSFVAAGLVRALLGESKPFKRQRKR